MKPVVIALIVANEIRGLIVVAFVVRLWWHSGGRLPGFTH